MNRFALLVVAALALPAMAQETRPEEIVITGRQPGPPLWKVWSGQHVLWIFGYLPLVPKDMVWESEPVAAVIAQSQEYLELPNTSASVSKLLLLNPLNIVRAYRLAKRVAYAPGRAPLSETLPPALYERFQAQKQRFFPGYEDIELRRPYFAADDMKAIAHSQIGSWTAATSSSALGGWLVATMP